MDPPVLPARRRILFHRYNSSSCSLEGAASTTEAAPSMEPPTPPQQILQQVVDDTPINVQQTNHSDSDIHENNKSFPTTTPLLFTLPTKSCFSNSRLQDLVPGAASDATTTSATASSAPQLRTLLKRKVSFGHIKIREHPRALGDHPAVSSGPALSLGWYSADPTKCQHSRTTEWSSVEAYEQARGRSPRSRNEIRLPRHERQKILLEQAGVTYSELHAYQQETAQLQRSRSQSLRDRNNLDDDETAGGPLIKMLQQVGKRLFLFHQKQTQDHSVEQKQLDELMARAQAAERVRRQQHQVAFWQSQRQTNSPPLHLLPLRGQPQTASTVMSTSSCCNNNNNPQTLHHSASEPFFVSMLAYSSVSSNSSSDSEDSEQPLDF
uniref:Uncharacterized protein n=1 Tax=Amphora coffeiformis TaxID=265554 RepID=A0A7S3P3Q1_9STRA